MGRVARIVGAAAVALALVVIAGCTAGTNVAPATSTVRVDASAGGSTVQLARGAELVVALEGNPTTGFDWKVTESLPPQLSAKSDTLESSAAPSVVGAGGLRVFTFTAAEAGTGELDMEYIRSWEKGVPPQRTFTLTVVVK